VGFTNVVWESRSTEQLARDLTDGPGPASVGQAGAGWVRVANEIASASADFDTIVERLRAAWAGQAATAALQRLEEFGQWLQAISLNAAANGQRAEQAAAANTVAVLAMPSVSEAIQAKASADMMASLAAYNGAVLTGRFAEFDEAASAHQANAAAVMHQYEDAVSDLAAPWDQPPPPQMSKADAANAQRGGADTAGGGGGSTATGGAGSGAPVMPLAPMLAHDGVKTSAAPKDLQQARFASGGSSGAGLGGMGSGYAPMAAGLGRGEQDRDYASTQPAGALQGAGDPAASPAESAQPWLPAAAHHDTPLTVSAVSWGPDTALFDEPPAPPQPPPPEGVADDPPPTLERMDNRWISPPVIGVDRGLRL